MTSGIKKERSLSRKRMVQSGGFTSKTKTPYPEAPKKVAFSDEKTIHLVPNVEEIKNELQVWDQIWYNVEEMEQIRQKCVDLLAEKKRGKFFEHESEDTFRGLDRLGVHRKRCMILHRAVEKEQDRQYQAGIRDAEKLARAALYHSKPAMIQARQRGASDAKAACSPTGRRSNVVATAWSSFRNRKSKSGRDFNANKQKTP